MKYQIRCLNCGKIISSDKYICKCSNGCDSLIRTEYDKKQIDVKKLPGIWKYIDWLPVKNVHKNLLINSAPITYKSKHLAKKLNLSNLLISFNGYWPERNANELTCSFKDLEAQTVLQRQSETDAKDKTLVIATDGNTGKAFLNYASLIDSPVAVFAREQRRLDKLWGIKNPDRNLKIVTLSERNDYYDVICLANRVAQRGGFIAEGGARNIARRDGMSIIMIDASFFNKMMPDHYFQALGSGPGAIAAFEASLRLLEDGRFGDKLPRIHGCQNYPFDPMYEAWKRKSRKIDKKYQMETAKELIKNVTCTALANRYPAYSMKGGIFDVLQQSNGDFHSVTNDEILKSCKLFEKTEGIDIEEPAGVAVAGLIQAVENKEIDKDEVVLLNVTGGGEKRYKEDKKVYVFPSDITIDDPEEEFDDVLEILE